ncbi:MAG: DUF1552 domain-containing protein [Phycisphaerae bacterium]|nr:DUF1552 domain-containing protein [Phycisphaerae bacterium]
MSHSISRRTLLRGAGCALAVPFLESMMPRAYSALQASAAAPARRTVFVFFPNGVNRGQWFPKEPGPLSALPPSLAPLEPYRARLSLIGGLAHANAEAQGDGPGDHARSAACFLTGAHPRKTAGADINAGVSIDQVIAERISGRTKFDSLELGLEPGMTAGNCDSGYSCAYSANISWKSPRTPMTKEHDPRILFERMFSVGPEGESEKARAARLAARRSILDGVRDEASRLRGTLGGRDRQKLDEYLDGVRSAERRIEMAEASATDTGADALPPRPAGVPNDWPSHAKLMNDLLVLSLRLDLTRVATFMLGNEGSNRPYPSIDVREGHHDISHHDRDERKLEKFAAINRHHAEQFADLLAKLDAAKDQDGVSLLDSTLLVYGGAIGDGNAHDHRNLPVILAGGTRDDRLTGGHGEYRRFDRERPMCDLYLSLAQRMGVTLDRFGDSTAPL